MNLGNNSRNKFKVQIAWNFAKAHQNIVCEMFSENGTSV